MNETNDTVSDIALLRRFEPSVRYTRGERFFPMEIDRYITQCSLQVQTGDGPPETLVPQGEMNLEKLIEPRQHAPGAVYFLKFIEPLDLLDLARYSFDKAIKLITHADGFEVFHAGRGRLARVGYSSRLMDALFSITLFLRGRVPGDTAAAAALTYRRMQEKEERYSYYGRVVRQDGWIVLQYWYFYPFNNWRSGFFGVNDHESDWEMVCIYCSDSQLPDGTCQVRPQWVAYASHDFSGDDLRRRWDDPEVEKVGEHAVIYAGAGSHASYFSNGEYITELELPFLAVLARLIDTVHDVWVKTLRQAGAKAEKSSFNVFRIPFVDYARGDGLVIGAGGHKNWEPELLDPLPAWVSAYRGLWGLYARDPISGENAPAGPMYNRDGTVRRAWYNPLGWSGLDKVPAPSQTFEVIARQREELNRMCADLRSQAEQKSTALLGLGIQATAVFGQPHLEKLYTQLTASTAAVSQELNALRRQLTVEESKLEALRLHEMALRAGDPGPLRAHIIRPHHPSNAVELRLERLAETFSAISIGLLMIGIVMLVVFARAYLLFGLAAMIGLLIFIESGFRRQLTRLVASLTIGLAVVTAIVLLSEFFWQVVVVGVLAAGLYIVWDNFMEVRS